jgi:hypothetical protein
MKYINTYDINRKMHAAPLIKIINEFVELHERFKNLEIKLEEPETRKSFDIKDVTTLLSYGPFHIGGKVKITTKGDYPIEILKECTDNIGNIFSFKDTSRTTWEILYKSEYGHYPDEKPIKK